MNAGHLKNFSIPLIAPLLVLILWEMTTVQLGLFPKSLVPSPGEVGISIYELLRDDILQNHISASLVRVIKGFLIATILGLSLGIWMGLSKTVDKFLGRFLDALRQIPSMAWIPLIILWFGIGETSKVVIIAKTAFFPILLNTIQGIRSTQKEHIELARMFELDNTKVLTHVIFPSALPNIFVGLRLALGFSWMVVVAAEQIAAKSGVGYMIEVGRELARPEVIIVGMVVIGIIGVIMDFGLRRLELYSLKWRRTFEGDYGGITI